MDREEILRRLHLIKDSIKADTLPNVYLFHGEISDTEMNDLYNHKKVKALVSLTKGEGFGRPLLEFSLTKKPIITTNWSGHTDFLDPKFTSMIGGELKQVHPSAVVKDMILEESQWFSPDINQSSQVLKHMFENYNSYLKGSTLQYHKSKNNFSYKNMVKALQSLVTTYIPEFPESVKLNLPKLTLPKLDTPKNFPNLKPLENV